MTTDIRLDAGDGDRILFQANALQSEAADILLDSPARRKKSGGHRRALVHDSDDGLTINFNGDYPAGVTIRNANLNLRVIEQEGQETKLPKDAVTGTLLLVLNVWGPRPTGEITQTGLRQSKLSLWLCVGRPLDRIQVISGDYWVPVPLGEPVQGTE